MSNEVTLMSVAKSEWIKFRTVRSTIVSVFIFVFLTLGLGALITWLIRNHYSNMPLAQRLTFDPVSTSLGAIIVAEFAAGVIGAMFISSEYTSGAIRTTLAAVPNRVRLILAKLFVLTISMIVVSEFVCIATFLIGMRIFSGVVPTDSLSNGSVLRAVLLSGVFLTLLVLFSFALGIILRQSIASISVFVSLLLVVPILGLFFPQNWQDHFQKFEPINLGGSMMATVPNPQNFAPWAACAVMAIYVVVLLAAGTTLFKRRDA
jgi:ABC-type transport system involved in multi-copper enzyme maturation permease subunit